MANPVKRPLIIHKGVVQQEDDKKELKKKEVKDEQKTQVKDGFSPSRSRTAEMQLETRREATWQLTEAEGKLKRISKDKPSIFSRLFNTANAKKYWVDVGNAKKAIELARDELKVANEPIEQEAFENRATNINMPKRPIASENDILKSLDNLEKQNQDKKTTRKIPEEGGEFVDVELTKDWTKEVLKQEWEKYDVLRENEQNNLYRDGMKWSSEMDGNLESANKMTKKQAINYLRMVDYGEATKSQEKIGAVKARLKELLQKEEPEQYKQIIQIESGKPAVEQFQEVDLGEDKSRRE